MRALLSILLLDFGVLGYILKENEGNKLFYRLSYGCFQTLLSDFFCYNLQLESIKVNKLYSQFETYLQPKYAWNSWRKNDFSFP